MNSYSKCCDREGLLFIRWHWSMGTQSMSTMPNCTGRGEMKEDRWFSDYQVLYHEDFISVINTLSCIQKLTENQCDLWIRHVTFCLSYCILNQLLLCGGVSSKICPVLMHRCILIYGTQYVLFFKWVEKSILKNMPNSKKFSFIENISK